MLAQVTSLNPFAFRASAERYLALDPPPKNEVSIPLLSGPVLNFGDANNATVFARLNPFAFRASAELQRCSYRYLIEGLNPFAFRASAEPRAG